MLANSVNNYHSTCNALSAAIQELNTAIKISEQNALLKESNEQKIHTFESNIILCNGVIDTIKPMVSDIQDYVAERKRESMQNINNALRLSGEIIQDATEGIYFKLDGDEAWLATPDDLEVQMVEGGGFRQISSTFLRSVITSANPEILQTLLLDEIFALVSPENSSVLSLYLNVICQDMQIISIEQKPQVYSNIDCVRYTFTKDNDYATVLRSDIKRGDNNVVEEASNES